MTFGEKAKALRVGKGLTLRAFCQRYGFSGPMVSQVERGRRNLPEDRLVPYLRALGVKPGPDWEEMVDLWHASRGTLPRDLTEAEAAAKLPVFFGCMRAMKDPAVLDKVVEIVRRG